MLSYLLLFWLQVLKLFANKTSTMNSDHACMSHHTVTSSVCTLKGDRHQPITTRVNVIVQSLIEHDDLTAFLFKGITFLVGFVLVDTHPSFL